MLILLRFVWAAGLVAGTFGAAYWVNPGDFFDTPKSSTPTNASMGKQLTLKNPLKWEELEPGTLEIEIDDNQLFGSCNLDIFGYTESGKSTISKSKSPFVKLASASFTKNDPKYKTNILDFKLSCEGIAGGDNCELYHMGYLEVSCGSNAEKYYSPIVPLGWFVHPFYKSKKMDYWAQAHCQSWFYGEDKKVREAVLSLACHPNHGYTESTAAEYNFIKVPHNIIKFDTYTPGGATKALNPAQKCYLSAPVASQLDADLHAAPTAECCFATPSNISNANYVFLFKQVEDPKFFLHHGSTAYRSHPFGVDTRWTDHYLVGQVPHLSHWYWDLLPYRYCCQWWPMGGCSEFYYKARPSPKLQPPKSLLKSAFLLGNFIARPFPASPATTGAFMCNKHGIFWLIKTASFKVQARTGFILDSNTKAGLKDVKTAKTSSPFITGLAIEVAAMPNLRFQIVASEVKYTYYVLVSDTSRKLTERIKEWSRKRHFGYVAISDVENPKSTHLDALRFQLTYKTDQLGIEVFVPQFGREFVSAMFTAGAGTAVSGGLLSLAASGGSLTYQSSQCEKFRVPNSDSIFVPFDEKIIDTVGAPVTGKPGTAGPGSATTPELKISGKKLVEADVDAVACLATKHAEYCKRIKESLKLMQENEVIIEKSDPKKDPFAYCTNLTDSNAVKVSAHLQDAGLGMSEKLFVQCPSDYDGSTGVEASCKVDAKTKKRNFELSPNFQCKLKAHDQKDFEAAVNWYKAQKNFKLFQHVEKAGGGPNSWRPGNTGGKRKGNGRSDDDRAGQLAGSAALVAATAAAAWCCQLASRVAA